MRATVCLTCLLSLLVPATLLADDPDLILHNGKIVTVDEDFSIADAVAVSGDRIIAVGSSAKILPMAGAKTEQVDLQGRTLIPGLIDSHVHPVGAATYEFDHEVPDVQTIDEALAYIKSRAELLPEGDWIRVQQMFITRLQEQRFPTREELDRVAPLNPVVYRTGPDLAVNSLALSLSGIDESYTLPPESTGKIERDHDGKLNGIIRGASDVIKYKSSEAGPTDADRKRLLVELMRDYNSVGITSISDRNSNDSAIGLYEQLRDDGELSVRVFVYYGINPAEDPDKIRESIETLAKHPLREYDNMLWVRGVKVFLDGGMLTGSAYMREPWGISKIYSINDPEYRGTLKIDPERLYQVSRLVIENGLQMTAHSVGDGAVENLIDAYEQVNKTTPIRDHRPCITHCNFMSAAAIERMKTLGIVADLQPAWLYLDGATLLKQFGEKRTEYFQPYRSLFDAGVIVGCGSDHMQKIGSLRSVNPYNPFLGMWITLSRRPRRTDATLHEEQRITREQAIRLYTINNAILSFEEKEKGSIEVGKLADFAVLDRDLLTCGLDEIRETKVLRTYLGGKLVYRADDQ